LNGKVKVKLSTSGVMPDSATDAFINDALAHSVADVTLADVDALSGSLPGIRALSGRIVYKPGSIKVNELNVLVPKYNANVRNSSFTALLSGVLTDPSKTAVDIQSFLILTDSCRLEGRASISNLTAPGFSVDANVDLNLKELERMLPEDSVVTGMSGRIQAKIVSKGHVGPDSAEDQAVKILLTQSSIKAYTDDVTVSLSDTLYSIKRLTGSVTLVPDTFMCEEISGAYKKMTFEVPSLRVLNIYKTIVKNEKEQLAVTADVKLGDVDYDVFVPFMPDTSTVREQGEAGGQVNYSFSVKGRFAANSFRYGKAEFKNISALYNLSDSICVVDKFRFDAFGGSASNSVRYRVKPDGRVFINTKHIIDRIDIHQLLSDFDNFKEFGNIEIKAENLGGVFSAKMHIGIVADSDSIDNSKTKIKGDIKIENGGIYNYKPAMDMAEFTGLKELDSIRFKTFESKIFMLKNKLFVPKTYIVSSALDIGFFGMQSLGEDYEYHIQLHLRDVLKGKSQKLLKRQQEAGDAVSGKDLDRSTVKLIYSFINGKSKVGFDRKKMQRMMKLKIKTQEKMLDLIFFPKLVSFDTGVE